MPGGFTQQYPPCIRNVATNTVSPIPCMEVNGAINYGGSLDTSLTGTTLGSGNASDILLNALNGGSGSANTNTNTNTTTNTPSVTVSVSDTLLNQSQSSQTGSGQTTSVQGAPTSGTQTSGQKPTQAQLTLALQQQGLSPTDARKAAEALLQGDISVEDLGATIVVRSRDPNSNTEVVGFYGGSTFNPGQSRSLIGRLCASRPWSGGFFSAVITPSFFDGLCRRAGYQVGESIVTASGGTTVRRPTITIRQPALQVATSSTVLEPEVDIWANPENVRLGTRTYVYWTTRNVESCKETGPSFSQNTLSGGAATVPISDASTFTIECVTPDGKKVTDSVRVNLAI